MSKKVVSFALVLMMFFTLAGCSNKNNAGYNTNGGGAVRNNSSDKQVSTADKSNNVNNKDSKIEDVRIKMTFNNEEIIVKMYDNPTSRDFLTLLPLTLKFEDYAGTEKISYLPRKLSIEDAPSGSDPDLGDFTLYAHWGNLAIFYKDFSYSNGLIILGKIESGIEKLANIRDDFTVKIEKID